MQKRKKTAEEERNDPIKIMERQRLERKSVQEGNWKNYLNAKNNLKDEIEINEGTDIMEGMLKERRDWINEYRQNHMNKIPDDIKPFYDRFNVEAPLSPEEEEAKRLAEEEEKGKKKKKGEKKAKKKKGKKSKDDDGGVQIIKIGASEVVQKFDEQYDDYTESWVNRDETDNYKQTHDIELAKLEVMPLLEEQFKADVDGMINMELENMKLLFGGAKKKKKGKKKGKKKKKKKKKGLKLPGYKQIKDMTKEEILYILIQSNIIKKIPSQSLTDFIGEFNYIHSMLDDIKETPFDPSMALIRQLVTEYIILPLGSQLVRFRILEQIRSFLFYGPAGTGKTMIVRSCLSETNSTLYDLSPNNIDNKFPAKKEEEKLIAMVMFTAKDYQPSIIYIDECEKVFPAKKKKKKGQKKKPKGDPSNPARIKKALGKWRAKFITPETRITIIGCTSEPEEGSKKDFKK